MTTYIITRTTDNSVQCLVTRDKKSYPLPHKVYHSPTGFEIGYGGSGPADLALSILADVYSEDQEKVRLSSKGSVSRVAWLLHQDFKWEFVANRPLAPGGTVVFDSATILSWATKKLIEGSK